MSKQVGEDIEIGVMNAGGVRADLKGGDVTYKDIFEVQPFGNAVITAKVSGEAVSYTHLTLPTKA